MALRFGDFIVVPLPQSRGFHGLIEMVMLGRRRTATVVALWIALGGCARPPFKSATVQIVPTVEGPMRISVTLLADPKPAPPCALFGPTVRATLDGAAMAVKGVGQPSQPMMISGIAIQPKHRCSGAAWFTIEGAQPRPSGTMSSIRIEDGTTRVEISARNVLAEFRADLEPAECSAGERVTLRVSPPDDPPLPVGGNMEVSIYGPNTRVAVIPGRDLTMKGRTASFMVPTLPPGRYRVAFQISDAPLTPLRCDGASECNIVRALAPAETVLTVR